MLLIQQHCVMVLEIYMLTFRGTATSAQYADLAEVYETEEELPLEQ